MEETDMKNELKLMPEDEVNVRVPVLLELAPELVRFYDDYAKRQKTHRAKLMRAALQRVREMLERKEASR